MATTINSGYANSPKLTANIADHADVYGGRALVFDGVTDYLDCGTGLGNQLGNYSKDSGLTISLWFKNSGANDDGIFQIGAGTGSPELYISLGYGGNLYFGLNQNAWFRSFAFSDTSSWHHLVCIYGSSSDNSKMYLDGEALGSVTNAGSFPSTINFSGKKTTIGNYWNLIYPFYGKMTDVKVFNTELTESQVTELYRKPENTPSAVQDNLVAWYPMIEGNPESPQSIVYDHSEKGLGNELISNGTFDSDISGWDTYVPSRGDILYSNGRLRVDNTTGTGNQIARIYTSFTSGKVYKISFDYYHVSGSTSSTINLFLGTVDQIVPSITSGQTTTAYMKAGADRTSFMIGYGGGSVYELDNITVKEVLMGNHATTNFFGDDLTNGHGAFDVTTNWSVVSGSLGTEWSIGSSKATHATGNTNTLRYSDSSNPMINGREYRIDFTISGRTAGDIDFSVGGGAASASNFTTSGNTTLTSGGTANRVVDIKPSSDFDGSVDLITVKEVGVSSSGFETAVNEPVVPQVPLMRYNQKMIVPSNESTDTYVLLPDGLTQGLTEFTFSIWHKKNIGDASVLFSVNGGGSYIRFLNATRVYAFLPAQTGGFTVDGTIVDDGNLHHYVLSISASSNESKLYVDGVLKATSTNDGNYYNANIRNIGNYAGVQTPSMHDEFSIFNTALTQTQVQELFNDGVALDATTHSKKGNLLGYWRNDGVTTWQDRRGWSFVDFDGTGDLYNCGNDSSLSFGTTDFSISFWANFSVQSSQGGRAVIRKPNNYYFWDYGNVNHEFRIYDGSTLKTLTFNTIKDDQWHYTTVTVDRTNNELKGYVDGVLISTVDISGLGDVGGSNDVEIGKNFIGSIKSASIYNKVRTLSEIQSSYNEGLVGNEASNDNLVGYWKLDTVDTATGALKDLSSNSNNGTVAGNPTLNDGNDGTVQGSPDSITIREGLNSNRDGLGFYFTNPSNNVLRLNGVDEYLEIDDSDVFSFGDSVGDLPFTISAWIKPRGTSALFRILDKSTSTSVVEYNLSIDSSSKCTLALYDSSTSNVIFRPSSSSIVADQWTFVTATYNGSGANSGINIYINDALNNGTASSSGSYTAMHNTTSTLKIGIRKFDDSFGNGLIDELRIYNKELSLAEIQKNYKHQKGKHKND